MKAFFRRKKPLYLRDHGCPEGEAYLYSKTRTLDLERHIFKQCFFLLLLFLFVFTKIALVVYLQGNHTEVLQNEKALKIPVMRKKEMVLLKNICRTVPWIIFENDLEKKVNEGTQQRLCRKMVQTIHENY
jgi:hypothetical protein